MGDDNRIRTACKNCGMTLKAKKKYAGRTLKCPGCGTPHMVPYAIDDDGGILASRRAGAAEEESSDAIKSIKPIDLTGFSAKPKVQVAGNLASIDNLLRSIYRCFEDGLQRGQAILADVALSGDKMERELLSARRDLTQGMRDAVREHLKNAQEKVHKIETHPMARSATLQAELEQARAELEGYKVFAKCFFDFKE